MKHFFLLIYCCIFLGMCTLLAQHELKKIPHYSFVRNTSKASDSLPVPIVVQNAIRANAFRAKFVAPSLKLGIMCVGEKKLENAIKIPLRLRLGSLAYTDWLEQKPNSFR